MKPRIEVFTPIRGIAAFFVAVSHMFFVWDYVPELSFLGNGNFFVVIFFVMSGFLMMYRHGEDLGSPMRFGGYISFIRNRISGFYPLYLISETIMFLYIVIGEVILRGEDFSKCIKHLIQLIYCSLMLQSLAPFKSVNHVLNNSLWYISALFIITLLSPALVRLMNKICRSSVIRTVLALIGTYCAYILMGFVLDRVSELLVLKYPGQESLLLIATPYINVFYYLFGMVICRLYLLCSEKGLRDSGRAWGFSVIEVILFLAIAAAYYLRIDNRITVIAIVGTFLILPFQKGIVSKTLCKMKMANFLGEISLQIYLIHYIFAVILVHLYRKVFTDSLFSLLVLFVLVWAMIIASSYLWTQLFKSKSKTGSK